MTYHLAAVSGNLGLSMGHTLVQQQQLTRWTKVQVLGSQGHAAPTHTVYELTLKLQSKRGGGAVRTASTQTLLSHPAFGVFPGTILEHRSESGCLEPASLPCRDSSKSSMQLTLPTFPFNLVFLEEPMHTIVFRSRGEIGSCQSWLVRW